MLKLVVALCAVGYVVCGPAVSRSQEDIHKYRDFLERSRTEASVNLPSGTSNASSAWVNSGKYQGDILLDREQIESMVQQYSTGRNAYIYPNTQWPGASIPYEFAAGHFDAAQINYILLCMSLLEEQTCIRFRPRRNNERNYVLITGNADGCYASVGYWADRGVHTLNVASDAPAGYGCLDGIVIIHEWLHVIGFFHTQSTYNRDEYVRINYENIVRGMEYNFDRFGPELVSNLGLGYDYESCMHYGTHDFSRNGRPTIVALRPHNGVLGQNDYVSGEDLMRVDRLYRCTSWKSAKDYKSIRFDGTTVITGDKQ